jgi:hypothetical protein
VHIEWSRVKRRPNWPWWSVVLPALCLALGGIHLLLVAHTGRQVQLCLLKRLTGCPCPTCGFTRGVLALLSGHPIQGWLYNPLLFSFLSLFAAVVGIRIVFGRKLMVYLSDSEAKAAWVLVPLLVAANWLYVIRYVG